MWSYPAPLWTQAAHKLSWNNDASNMKDLCLQNYMDSSPMSWPSNHSNTDTLYPNFIDEHGKKKKKKFWKMFIFLCTNGLKKSFHFIYSWAGAVSSAPAGGGIGPASLGPWCKPGNKDEHQQCHRVSRCVCEWNDVSWNRKWGHTHTAAALGVGQCLHQLINGGVRKPRGWRRRCRRQGALPGKTVIMSVTSGTRKKNIVRSHDPITSIPK